MSHDQTSAATQLPIACTLQAGDAADRLARWKALAERAEPTVRREADRIVVAYPADPITRAELEALAAAERQCCAFARWEISKLEDHVLLSIIANADGLNAISELVAADVAASDAAATAMTVRLERVRTDPFH